MVALATHDLPEVGDIEAELASRHLAEFIPSAWHAIEPFTTYRPSWHIAAICEHLEAVVSGQIRNLLINMPPRMMKSLTVSVFFPAWLWITRPWTRFLYSSYSQDLATDHSLATRRVIESDWYQERWADRFAMAGDQNLKTRFENDHRGARIATSVGGTATGKGGDIVVVDDPHNVLQAESDAIRESTLLWWDRTMSTRLNDPKHGAKIIVMQRVHERDLSGHVLAQGGYEHLALPMEYEPTTHATGIGWRDPRTEPGELLAPGRFGPQQVADAKVRLGSYAYAGQHQQRPAPAAGGIVKRDWWRSYRAIPADMDDYLQSWDMTFRETDSGSYVVGQVWGKRGAERYLLDQVRARMDFPTAVQAVRNLTAKWPQATAKLVENKANGPAIVSSLRGQISGMIEVEPEGGKIARANAVAPQIEAGNVYLPDPTMAPWVGDYVEEFAAFPNGAHDDQVDATTQALVRWAPATQPSYVEPVAMESVSTWGAPALGGWV